MLVAAATAVALPMAVTAALVPGSPVAARSAKRTQPPPKLSERLDLSAPGVREQVRESMLARTQRRADTGDRR